jgi:hypothetical protein
MPAPIPPVPLKDHCSAIYNNTLYVYSAEAFQSISLSQGAQWNRLSSGVAVSGARCVKVVPRGDEGQAALWIVGGSANSSTAGHSGLQRFRFADQSWANLTPSVWATQNRRNHGAVYLNASRSILTYGGSQESGQSQPTSQTFLISTVAPYSVTSYSSKAPPLTRPLLLPWNDTHAVMLGGDSQNRRIHTFSREDGWVAAGVALDQGFPDDSKVQAVIVNRDDGSKLLETFDLSVSPNSVNRTVLRSPGSTKPLLARSEPRFSSSSSASLSSSSLHSSYGKNALGEIEQLDAPPAKRRKRDSVAAAASDSDSHPTPTAIRTGFSLAQSPNGLVVLSGGNDQDPLLMFDTVKDSWVDPTDVFGAVRSASPSPENPTPSGGAAPTASLPSPSPPAPSTTGTGSGVSGSVNNDSRPTTVLGATLGSIFGIALLATLTFLFLRHRRRRKTSHANDDDNGAWRSPRADGGGRRSRQLADKHGAGHDVGDGGVNKYRLTLTSRGGQEGNFMGPAISTPVPLHSYKDSGSSMTLFSSGGVGGGGGGSGDTGITGGERVAPAAPATAAPAAAPAGPLPRGIRPSREGAVGVGGMGMGLGSVAPVAMPRPLVIPDPDRERSSGWSRYFQNGSPLELVQPVPGMAVAGPDADDRAATTTASSTTGGGGVSGSQGLIGNSAGTQAAARFASPRPPPQPPAPVLFGPATAFAPRGSSHQQLQPQLQQQPRGFRRRSSTAASSSVMAHSIARQSSDMAANGVAIASTYTANSEDQFVATAAIHHDDQHHYSQLQHYYQPDSEYTGLGEEEEEEGDMPPPLGVGMMLQHEEEGASWSPVGRDEWSSGRAPSSVYTDSAHGSIIPRDFNAALFPPVPRDSVATVRSAGTATTAFPRGSYGGGGGYGGRGGGGGGGDSDGGSGSGLGVGYAVGGYDDGQGYAGGEQDLPHEHSLPPFAPPRRLDNGGGGGGSSISISSGGRSPAAVHLEQLYYQSQQQQTHTQQYRHPSPAAAAAHAAEAEAEVRTSWPRPLVGTAVTPPPPPPPPPNVI